MQDGKQSKLASAWAGALQVRPRQGEAAELILAAAPEVLYTVASWTTLITSHNELPTTTSISMASRADCLQERLVQTLSDRGEDPQIYQPAVLHWVTALVLGPP